MHFQTKISTFEMQFNAVNARVIRMWQLKFKKICLVPTKRIDFLTKETKKISLFFKKFGMKVILFFFFFKAIETHSWMKVNIVAL